MLKFLRFTSIGIALLLTFASVPLLFLSLIFPGEVVVSIWASAAIALGLLVVFNSGFVFIFIFGDRIVASPSMRLIAALLLSIPIGITLLPLLKGHTEFGPVFIPLLLFSSLLFSAFAFPAWLKPASNIQP